jgi:hypothetical protein
MIVRLGDETRELTEKEKSLVELYNSLSTQAKQKVMAVKLPGQQQISEKIESLPEVDQIIAKVKSDETMDRIKKIVTWGSLALLVYKVIKS